MISIKDIRKTYFIGKNEIEILKGVNLEVSEGEYVAIMGTSGSGKSTFLNIIGCLDKATSGTYVLDGKNIAELNDDQLSEIRCQKVGFVFQAYNLLPKLNAIDNVELPAKYLGMDKETRHKRAEELLIKVGLEDRMLHFPNELSGGQKQRIAIARALINNPRIIFADEATGNLDSKSTEEILQIFKTLNDSGVTIIMVTHEEDVARHTKRIVRLKDGVIQSDSIVTERLGV
ncbi:ABC transporter ATP-binding protein [Caviibacter abscessus]|uniref:ABC transporter ATP-binding protein n=1 Tax=Caviibacter abscessus TaxID=1766719 RepID=UPI00082FD82B|nr:ABC transporter ATP-binding protein [Caviibacter abscessus]